eukprot:CAMPEP_0114672980 /NCGR_PEP_ID=MMETSP0191-20121206/43880_1 /TAXON_ID=126664 /ORGANISM="Sorites sp." /LENGTH=150 /DNA_ID=CAMNT_0001936725 /DNA_START=1303 /DNA_END=1755 /DNA_ORIENTATION=-
MSLENNIQDQLELALLIKRLRIDAEPVPVKTYGKISDIINDMDDKPRINKKARIQERKDNIRDYNAKNHTEIEIVSTPLATNNNNNNNAFEGNASGSSSESIIPNEFGTTKIPKGLLDAKAKSLKDFGDITDIDNELKSINDINGIKTES